MDEKEARLAVIGAISAALKDPTLQKGFKCICKENAELKEKHRVLERDSKNLVKAKEIIKIGLEGIKKEFVVAGNTRPYAAEALKLCNEYCEKAEAFLKE